MREIFHTQVIEERWTCAMLFFYHANLSNAPGDKSPVCRLLASDVDTRRKKSQFLVNNLSVPLEQERQQH